MSILFESEAEKVLVIPGATALFARGKGKRKNRNVKEFLWLQNIDLLLLPQKNSSQYHYVQGPSLLIITALCQKFWKPSEYLLGTTKTLR